MKKALIGLIALTLLIAVPTSAGKAAGSVCQSDQQLSTIVRQKVNTATSTLQSQLRVPLYAHLSDQLKKQIDATSLRTGGKLRDIYVGGASTRDKQDMVQEFLLSRFGDIEDLARTQAEQKADQLIATADAQLNGSVPFHDNARGNASASRSVPTSYTNTSRSGSFKLQNRNWLGLNQDAGRFNYTVTVSNTVSVQQVHFNESYSTCSNNQTIDNSMSYGTRVVITPYIFVGYSFNVLGHNTRYRSFSGSFTILNSNDRVTRELNVDRPL